MSLPKISIIMPVLNREQTIEKAIQSILDQRYPNLELIILDGGSTDNTIEIIKRYQSSIHYWHSKNDGSPVVAINMGIEIANGDLIGILMADDWYEADTLNKIGQAYLANPTVDMVTCGGRIMAFDEGHQAYYSHWIYDRAKDLALTIENICFAASAICTRFITKRCYQRIGVYQPFDERDNFFFSNDKAFLLRAIFTKCKDMFIPHLGHTYFANELSTTFGNHRQNIMKLCSEHMRIAEGFLQQNQFKLANKQIRLLRYWYNDQATRLFIYELLAKNFRAAISVIKTAWRKYPVLFPLHFCRSVIRIICKMIVRRFK